MGSRPAVWTLRVTPWIPFDADAEEIESLHVVREGIPSTLRPVLLAWIYDQLPLFPYSSLVTPEVIHTFQSALRIDFGLDPKGSITRDEFVDFLSRKGDRTVLRSIDYLAAAYEPDNFGRSPAEIDRLEFHLDTAASAFEIYVSDDGNYRLRKRVPEGVEEAVQSAIDLQPSAGRHLANAWGAAFAFEPNASLAMSEGIRAVEAACGPVVLPKDGKATLGKVVKSMQAQGGWRLVLADSDGYPDHKAVLLGMMETLAKAQPDRHSGEKPTILEAQAHVQLAATLVHWFGSGAVMRDPA